MKIKKVIALLLALVMVLGCVTSFAAMEDVTNENFYVVKHSIDNEDCASEVITPTVGTEGYCDESGNTMWFSWIEGNASKYFITSASEISSDFTGKCVINNKMRLSGYTWRASNNNGIELTSIYNNDDLNTSYMGFKIIWSTPYTGTPATVNTEATVNYIVRRGSLEKAYTLGTYTLELDDWYTYSQVYDLDNKIAHLYAYDVNGQEVFHFQHQIDSVIDGTTIPYKNLYTRNIRCDINNRVKVTVDDYVAAKVTAVPVTATFDEEFVSVTYGGQEVTSGVATPVTYNEDAVFAVEPKGDYEITGITVDGEPIESKSQVTFEDIREAHSFSVSVKEDDYYKTLHKTNFSEHASEIVGTDLTGGDCVGKSGYVKVGNGYAWLECANSANTSEWLVPVGNNKVSDSFSGEYTINNKIRFVNYGSYAAEGWAAAYLRYDSADPSRSYFAFKTHWASGGSSTTGTATVSFVNTYTAAVSKEEQVGTWDYVSNEEYTYRSVFNLDNKTADYYVFDSSGAEVAHFSYDIPDSINGTEIPYKDVATSSLSVESKNRGAVFAGDYKFAETIAKPVTVKYDAEMGSVKVDNTVVANGEKIPVAYNSDSAKIFSIKAADGYEISDIKVNGESKGNLIDSYEFKNITADQELEVIFAVKAPVVPSVEVTEYKTAKDYVYNAGGANVTSPYSVIMYGKITGAPESYGFALSNGKASVKLPSKGIGENGTFAIRVVGGAIIPGSYTATPFWTDGEEKSGEAFSITVNE